MKTHNNQTNASLIKILAIVIAFAISPLVGVIYSVYFFLILRRLAPAINTEETDEELDSLLRGRQFDTKEELLIRSLPTSLPESIINQILSSKVKLEKRKKYLHIALNSTLKEAREIISQLPVSERILIETGTPLLKIYGIRAIDQIKKLAPPGTYIVADNKCADLAQREVKLIASAGASAATCLGVSPVETIDSFIEECEKSGIDSMIDMMNVENAVLLLKKLKKLPTVVMLHRGVDETVFSREKQIPFYQIKQIKGSFNCLVAVAGGDTIKEVQRAIFNDADIVVVWKNFYQATKETAKLAELFLKEIK